jgi:anaerobic selenocysteine-containing dehydrogenase
MATVKRVSMAWHRAQKGVADRLIVRTGERTQELARVPAGGGHGQVSKSKAPTETVTSVCGFCATGCSLRVHVRDGVAVNITPTLDYPVNVGEACPKGWESLASLRATDRVTLPKQRLPDGSLHELSWDAAAMHFVTRMREVQRVHGPASAAFLSTGQITTEEMALLGAFAKFEMGMVHGDGNTRQCMATSAVAHKQAFGFDSPPFTYADLEESDVIVLIGSNLCIAHPILWQRITNNRHSPTVITVDPRRTETAAASSMHLALRPASDLALLCGVARQLVTLGAVDHDFVRAHTQGFDDWVELVDPWTLDACSEATGVSIDQITALASTIAQGQRVSLWWTMGVNQGHQAVRTAQAVINIALMTGNIGRPGTGANSITGQCNAMGSRLYANTTNLFAGRDFADESHRAEVAAILGVPVDQIPKQPSLAYDQILDGIEDGTIRALWIVATNPAHSWIDSDRARRLLGQLEFLVVQDLFLDTLTASYAHLVLPAAGWGEKDGTFINAERRIGRTRQASKPPAGAKTDFEIFRLLAEAWGTDSWLDRWASPEEVFAILQKLSAGRPCDMTGIEGYSALDTFGGVQWPYVSDPNHVGPEQERRLFADGQFFHPDGRARFVVEAPAAPPNPTTASFPLTLLTGRGSSSQWHTGTRTGRSEMLRSLSPGSTFVELHPRDALSRGVAGGDRVTVRSPRGEMEAVASVSTLVSEGSVFVAMHDPALNPLLAPTADPHSRQPAYKHTPVNVTPVRP